MSKGSPYRQLVDDRTCISWIIAGYKETSDKQMHSKFSSSSL